MNSRQIAHEITRACAVEKQHKPRGYSRGWYIIVIGLGIAGFAIAMLTGPAT